MGELCTVGTRLSRVRFTVSGCVSCGGRFGLRTVEDAGPYDNEDFGVAAVGGGHG